MSKTDNPGSHAGESVFLFYTLTVQVNLFHFFSAFELNVMNVHIDFVHIQSSHILNGAFNILLDFSSYLGKTITILDDDRYIHSSLALAHFDFNTLGEVLRPSNSANPPAKPPLMPATPLTSTVANPAITSMTSGAIWISPISVRSNSVGSVLITVQHTFRVISLRPSVRALSYRLDGFGHPAGPGSSGTPASKLHHETCGLIPCRRHALLLLHTISFGLDYDKQAQYAC